MGKSGRHHLNQDTKLYESRHKLHHVPPIETFPERRTITDVVFMIRGLPGSKYEETIRQFKLRDIL